MCCLRITRVSILLLIYSKLEFPMRRFQTPAAAMGNSACGDGQFRTRRWTIPHAAFSTPFEGGRKAPQKRSIKRCFFLLSACKNCVLYLQPPQPSPLHSQPSQLPPPQPPQPPPQPVIWLRASRTSSFVASRLSRTSPTKFRLLPARG